MESVVAGSDRAVVGLEWDEVQLMALGEKLSLPSGGEELPPVSKNHQMLVALNRRRP